MIAAVWTVARWSDGEVGLTGWGAFPRCRECDRISLHASDCSIGQAKALDLAIAERQQDREFMARLRQRDTGSPGQPQVPPM